MRYTVEIQFMFGVKEVNIIEAPDSATAIQNTMKHVLVGRRDTVVGARVYIK